MLDRLNPEILREAVSQHGAVHAKHHVVLPVVAGAVKVEPVASKALDTVVRPHYYF